MTMSFAHEWRRALSSKRCTLPATARHVGLAASLYADPDGPNVRPGAARLADDTGLSTKAVRAALATLVDAGWLRLSHRGGRKGQKREANTYTLVIPNGGTRVTHNRGLPVNVRALTPEPGSPHQDNTKPATTSSDASADAPVEAVDYQSAVEEARAAMTAARRLEVVR